MNTKYIGATLTAVLISITSLAQHQHEHMPPKDTVPQKKQQPAPKKDSMPPMDMEHMHDTLPPGHAGHDHAAMDKDQEHGEHHMDMGHDHDEMEGHGHHQMSMSHAFSKNLPMTRNGSGTSWLPDNSPVFGYMFHSEKGWMYMLHGDVYLRYNKQDLLEKGSRGGSKFDAPNMMMLMGQKQVGAKGLFHFNTMFSLDPLTVGAGGYPLLFQTGEAYKGQPLVDRQHPHDLFSELSFSYAQALSKKADLFVYLGYPGEPALGPAAYVHRPSGFFNPDAPLSHHWVDATHITFGVATIGLRYGQWKLEGSSFTGREPDEHRYNFDQPRFDSWSGRLSFNPSDKWAWQVSHGFIKEPEALHPGEDVHRTTASATYSARGFGATFTNFTAVWGMNKTKGHHAGNAILLEGSRYVKNLAVYSRYEWVQKSVEELNLDEVDYGTSTLFPVHAFTAGLMRDLFPVGQTRVALGAQITFYAPDKRLSSLYGQNPLSAEVYLRIYPGIMGSRMGSIFLPY